MFKSMLIMFILMIGIVYGCAKHEPKIDTPPDTDNATVEIAPVKSWNNPLKKEFWTVMLFTQLSNMPGIRQRFVPKHLHLMVRCVVDEYESRFELDYFEKVFGQPPAGSLSPENAAIAYDITYQCSAKQMLLQNQDFQRQQTEPLKLKNSI